MNANAQRYFVLRVGICSVSIIKFWRGVGRVSVTQTFIVFVQSLCDSNPLLIVSPLSVYSSLIIWSHLGLINSIGGRARGAARGAGRDNSSVGTLCSLLGLLGSTWRYRTMTWLLTATKVYSGLTTTK